MSKNKHAPTPTPDPEGVDMDKIKKIMGPLPDEPDDTASDKVKKAPNESLAQAAEEANQVLKAMDPELDATEVKTIEEAPTDDLPINETVTVGEALAAAENTPDSEDPLEDPVIDQAVDEIVAHEGDVVLETEDIKPEAENTELKSPKKGFKQRLKGLWTNKKARWAIIFGVLLSFFITGVVPASRYFVLNNLGARSSLSIKVLDSTTLQPLKNVEVQVGSVTGKSGDDGVAKLDHLKLGSTNLSIKKRAFSEVTKPIIVGWGSNPQGDIKLQPTGAQYTIVVKDFLSGKPIEKVVAASGEGNASSDKDGKIVITLDTSDKKDGETIEINLTGENYRSEVIKIAVENKTSQNVSMVPARKHVFVSKRSGTYDIYSIDVDGKNEKKLVTGTGVERNDITLLPDKTGSFVAYAATRENSRNSGGYLLTTLYVLDVAEASLTKVDQSEQIQLIGWSSDGRVGYIKIVAGTSAANPNRTKLMSYNTKNETDKKELASANYFNDVAMFGSKVYYTPGNDTQKTGLFTTQLDGTAKTTVLDNKLVWNLHRTSYDTLQINANGTWYTHKLGTSTATTTGAAATTQNRLYTDSNSGKTSVWTDERDGKGVLLAYDVASAKDTVLATKSGLRTPLYWLDSNNIVFRVNDGKELADYVVSVNGGEAKKIVNVTDTAGADRWFYY